MIPETWDTLEDFCQWYRSNGCPIRVPQNARVLSVEGSLTVVIFRRDVYQVELYLALPDVKAPRHSHPFEQKIIFLGGHFYGARGDRKSDGTFDEPISSGWFGSSITENSSPELPHAHAGSAGILINEHQWHELAGDEVGQGFVFLNCQKWPNKETMSSALIEYDGELMDSTHEKLMVFRPKV